MMNEEKRYFFYCLDCVHLLSAVSRLPKKLLANGYIPKCTVEGYFEKVQCDKVYCWCADSVQGWEIPGTKVFKENGPPNCQSIVSFTIDKS